MKIVIAGMGTTGNYLARVLQKENHDLVLIERDEQRFRAAQEMFDAQVELGDVSDHTVLEPLIDENVDIFIALTDDDSINIIGVLIARKFGARRAITRINDPDHLIHPLLTDDTEISLLNAEMIVSKDLIRMVGTPSADEVEFFAKGKAEMVKLQVCKESPIAGKKLNQVKVPSSWLVAARIREGNFVIASGETEFLVQDHALVVGDPNRYRELEALFKPRVEKVRRVILIGFNEISARLAQTLDRKHIEVRLIEENKDRAAKASRKLDGVLVLQGDGTDEGILDEAGVAETDYVIALTDDDETNVLISLLAKEKGVHRVVTLTHKMHYRRIIQKIGIDSVINPRSSMVDEIIRVIHHKDLLGINILEGGQGRMMEFIVSAKTRLVDKPLSKAKFPKQILLGAIVRGDELIVPRGNTKIRMGDRVVVFSTLSVLSEVKRLFGG